MSNDNCRVANKSFIIVDGNYKSERAATLVKNNSLKNQVHTFKLWQNSKESNQICEMNCGCQIWKGITMVHMHAGTHIQLDTKTEGQNSYNALKSILKVM